MMASRTTHWAAPTVLAPGFLAVPARPRRRQRQPLLPGRRDRRARPARDDAPARVPSGRAAHRRVARRGSGRGDRPSRRAARGRAERRNEAILTAHSARPALS
ncbi:hypothetical protein SCATT_01800 [Streptantibioticus cattleyicolor NRRL 8057 = DSM 46488]|uniref:Uncharacterized protein n=1 Tax=Streptantibioticus cattleyicolor (strain ATCC 35852 / DSM 46488 / JCM 4925 / NBRC 14057 / NRRL 8057) TaxID=1003195 RepID=G8X1M2_STREN|nr:hypothetical protein SCATT_01800 [Streptantibioticus cattleyicolor NRRL 8057 = DSM 46488]